MAWTKRSKYHAEKTSLDGSTFDSRKEAQRFAELSLLEKAGEIYDLECQVEYELIPPQKYRSEGRWKALRGVKYIADFRYTTKDGETVVEDVKGFKTDAYKIKRKLMLERYGILVREV